MKLSLSVTRYATTRTYATRRPERPPSKIKDPLLSPNATHHRVSPTLTFIHRAPPTARAPFSLTIAPSSPLLLPRSHNVSQPAASPSNPTGHLPPLIKSPRKKPAKRLGEKDVQEIKRLRSEDPVNNTRSKLAEQFGCSPHFIPIAAPLSKTRKREALTRRDQAHDENRNRWGEKKRLAVAIRQKRRTLW